MKIFSLFGTIAIVLGLLVYGDNILIPVVIALFLWHLILAVGDGVRHYFNFSKTVSILCSVFLVGVFFFFPINLAIHTLPEVVEESLKYQTKIDYLMMQFLDVFSLSKEDILAQIKNYISIPTIVSVFATTLTGLTANLILVLLYIAFLFYDYRFFSVKMKAMFPHKEDQKWILSITDRINQRIKTYLWVKTFLAIIGGVLSYVIFAAVGLHFAEFWAVMIFFLGYIPTIGAILGVIFPALLCLVQFDSLAPFLVVSIGCGIIHFFIGNVLEPKLLGDSMNLSTIVILLSLVLWSSLWGVIGAFLSVPMTMIILIICAEFPKARPIAIALSAEGNV